MRAKHWVLLLLLCDLMACSALSPAPAYPHWSTTAAPLASPTAALPLSHRTGADRIFYVAPDGDNANPGTRDRPWATPGYGSRQLAPGDTLVILGGRYVYIHHIDEFGINIYGRGDANPETTPWAPIVIDQVEQANARFEIVNVTVDDHLGQNYLMYVQYGNPVPVQVAVRNTIFSGRGPDSSVYIGATSTLIANHNLFYLRRASSS